MFRDTFTDFLGAFADLLECLISEPLCTFADSVKDEFLGQLPSITDLLPGSCGGWFSLCFFIGPAPGLLFYFLIKLTYSVIFLIIFSICTMMVHCFIIKSEPYNMGFIACIPLFNLSWFSK